MADEQRVHKLREAIQEKEKELRDLTQREGRDLVELGLVKRSMSVAEHQVATKAIAQRAAQRRPEILRISEELIKLEAQLAALE